MANGTIHKLGTPYVGGAKKPLPTRPWQTGSTPTGQSSAGNLCDYGNGSSAVEIKNTDADDAYKLQWVEVNDGSDRLLICDRNILVNIQWDRLNALGFCGAKGSGKIIAIDGQNYELFMLTGGVSSSAQSEATASNEWEKYIGNLGGFAGLPTPTAADLDNSLSSADYTGAHGGLWHWAGCYSWCQNMTNNGRSYRALRGCSGARSWTYDYSYNYSDNIGFRPALRIRNTAPQVTPTGKSYGVCIVPPAVSVSVSDSEGDAYTGVVKVDGTWKQTFSGTGSETHALSVSSWWSGLALGDHTINVTVTDSKGAATAVTYTLHKANGPAAAPAITNLRDGLRRDSDFYVEFSVGADPEGDAQTMTVQVSVDAAFANRQEFTALEKKTGDGWTAAETVPASETGGQYRIKATGQPSGQERYIRVVSTDSGSNTAACSAAVKIRIGTVLEIQTRPLAKASRPCGVSVHLNAVIDPAADLSMWVCNNAYDPQPSWEVYTPGSRHTFANQDKTADNWAVSAKVKVTAGEAAGEISISAIGMGVN